jgi:hypothetical protein
MQKLLIAMLKSAGIAALSAFLSSLLGKVGVVNKSVD